MPNLALADGEIDANYFQHEPYLLNFNAENNTELVSAVAVHYEPMGIYSSSKSSLDEIAEGDIIAVPNDGTNEAAPCSCSKLKDSSPSRTASTPPPRPRPSSTSPRTR